MRSKLIAKVSQRIAPRRFYTQCGHRVDHRVQAAVSGEELRLVRQVKGEARRSKTQGLPRDRSLSPGLALLPCPTVQSFPEQHSDVSLVSNTPLPGRARHNGTPWLGVTT